MKIKYNIKGTYIRLNGFNKLLVVIYLLTKYLVLDFK